MKNRGFSFLVLLALAASVVLGTAAVWMGGLNQDEGWYLYAANLVAEGKVPYRDFFYTQGPLMPIVYSAFNWIWNSTGLLGARVFTLLIGFAAVGFAAATAARMAPADRRGEAALAVLLLLGCNLYHLYYTAIPKTYALASLFVAVGFWLLACRSFSACFIAGLSLAFAAGTRISLGAILPVAGLWLLGRKEWKCAIAFAIGGFLGLGLVYGPFVLDQRALDGLFAAQRYHTARGGFDPVWTVGSVSRLVRWYLPVFVLLAVVTGRLFRGGVNILLFSSLAVFLVQIVAPFPYEDYQVPVMGLLTVAVAVLHAGGGADGGDAGGRIRRTLLVTALAFAGSFGSPLLEQWSVNGQDRFWSLKKDRYELAQLREVAREIEMLDPDGREILTQDLYLAIETGRKVPEGLEMGPFSMLDDSGWRKLLSGCQVPIAALSGYTFAIEPPVCNERTMTGQLEYWKLVRERYELVDRVENFGQNHTPLLILRRK